MIWNSLLSEWWRGKRIGPPVPPRLAGMNQYCDGSNLARLISNSPITGFLNPHAVMLWKENLHMIELTSSTAVILLVCLLFLDTASIWP